MKKKDLLKYIPDKWPDQNEAKAIKTSEGSVLMLVLPDWEVIGHQNEPGVIHFVWKKGYLTYFPKSHIWERKKYTNVYYNAYVASTYFDPESNDEIKNFTNISYIAHAVESYERNIDFCKRQQALDNKQKRIDKKMECVPALPVNFKRFCIKKLKKEKKVYIKLFQDTGIGTIERIFSVERTFSGTYRYDGQAMITEICRGFSKSVGTSWTSWYYGEFFGRYGKKQKFWDRKTDTVVNVLPKRHYIYDNLDSLELTEAEKDTVRLLDGLCDPSSVLNKLRHNPQIEYIAKRGCLRLAAELVNEYGFKKIEISKETSKRLKNCNGGMSVLKMLEAAPKIRDQYLKDFSLIKDSYKANIIIELAKQYNINHVYSLLLKSGGMTITTVNRYKDYLDMAEWLGHDPHDEIIYRSKNWQTWHDRYSEEISRMDAKKRDLCDNRRYRHIRDDYRLNKALFEWENKEYIMIVPKSAKDINEEGRRQHHCVGSSDTYKDKMNKRVSFIVFMRKKESPREPYYTIECDEKGILQYYAAYDKKPNQAEVSQILSEWMKSVKINFKKLNEAAV